MVGFFEGTQTRLKGRVRYYHNVFSPVIVPREHSQIQLKNGKNGNQISFITRRRRRRRRRLHLVAYNSKIKAIICNNTTCFWQQRGFKWLISQIWWQCIFKIFSNSNTTLAYMYLEEKDWRNIWIEGEGVCLKKSATWGTADGRKHKSNNIRFPGRWATNHFNYFFFSSYFLYSHPPPISSLCCFSLSTRKKKRKIKDKSSW